MDLLLTKIHKMPVSPAADTLYCIMTISLTVALLCSCRCFVDVLIKVAGDSAENLKPVSVVSLGWVTPGAATEGVTLLFFS